MKLYLKLFIFAVSLSQCIESAKILVYNPKNKFISHPRYISRMADFLQDNGHEVTVYQPDYDGLNPANPTKAKIYNRRFNETVIYPIEEEEAFLKYLWEDPAEDLQSIKRCIAFIESIFISSCKYQLEDKEALEYLKNENFDLGIAESCDNCGFGIFHAIGLNNKTIALFTLPFLDNLPSKLGLPRGESYIPSHIGGNEVKMNFWGRIQNLYRLWHTDSMQIYGMDCKIEKIVQEKIDSKYTTANAIASSAFIFMNSEEHLDFPRPITPKIVYIGGFNLDLKHEESEDIDTLVGDFPDGFIYFSLGSVARSSDMPKHMKNAFLETFKRFPNIKFLWKYETSKDNIAAGLSNVITKEWFNQLAIFDHPKLITFITHGGMNSLIEFSYKGIPSISIPLFADQYRNANLLKYRKTGIILLKNEISPENLEAKINLILKDKSFKENALKLAKMMNSKPFSPKDKFLKHVEFAAKNGNFDNFNLHGTNLNFIEYYNLDIYGILVSIFIALTLIILRGIFKVHYFFRNRLRSKTKKL